MEYSPIWKFVTGSFAGWVSDADQDVFNARGEHVGYVFASKTIYSLTGQYLGERYDKERVGASLRRGKHVPASGREQKPALEIVPRANKRGNPMPGWADPFF